MSPKDWVLSRECENCFHSRGDHNGYKTHGGRGSCMLCDCDEFLFDSFAGDMA